MPASSEFFGERHPQAVLKHGILTRYADHFSSRAGLATQGRVAFIDGYAGEGRYKDGTPGSPILLASEGTRAQIVHRRVMLAFVERDEERREALRESLELHSVRPDQLLGGDFQQSLMRSSIGITTTPFFCSSIRSDRNRLRDVCGILSRSLKRRPIYGPYHFSLSTVARMVALP